MKYSDHPDSTRIKLLLVGDPKSGKTGLLATLANAGYKVRILDLDNNLQIIKSYVERPEFIEFVSVPAKDPQTWEKSRALLRKWDDGTNPEDWTQDTVLVIDSSSFWVDAAMQFAKEKVGNKVGDKAEWDAYDKMNQYVEHEVARLASPKFSCHVILTAHFRTLGDEKGIKKAFPSFPGQQLPKIVARYMNNVWAIDIKNDGKRVIRTQTTPILGFLGCSAPKVVKPEESFDLGDVFLRIEGKQRS